MFRVLAVFVLVMLTGCSSNLDAQCADLFEQANDVLVDIADAQDIGEIEAGVVELDGLSQKVESLQSRVTERFKEGGPFCKEFAYRGQECEERLVFDETNKRKSAALNRFQRLWHDVGARPPSDAIQQQQEDQTTSVFNRLNSETLDELLELSWMCNKTLR